MSELTDLELKARADAFFDVENQLRYEYEGPYDLSSISEFFDEKAREILSKLES